MFEGQSVAITGAKGGIGRAIAEMFVGKGAKVAISDRETPTATAAEIGTIAFACDVTDEDSIIDFIDMAEASNGPIDIFVSNAGVGFGDPDHAAGASNKAWELSWGVNVMGAVYAARSLLPAMQTRGSGRFIIIASAAGLLNQLGSASYSATKHAAVGFAEALAIRHWDEGIKTHCVCPQYVRTNFTKGMEFAETHPDGLLEPEDVAAALEKAIAEDQFMVLSHPMVGEYLKQKSHDYQAYITGMNKLKQKIGTDFLPK